jgi:citrate lyase beta subunit
MTTISALERKLADLEARAGRIPGRKGLLDWLWGGDETSLSEEGLLAMLDEIAFDVEDAVAAGDEARLRDLEYQFGNQIFASEAVTPAISARVDEIVARIRQGLAEIGAA